jgi:hypothetical protein
MKRGSNLLSKEVLLCLLFFLVDFILFVFFFFFFFNKGWGQTSVQEDEGES